jgi:stress response protein SCP2
LHYFEPKQTTEDTPKPPQFYAESIEFETQPFTSSRFQIIVNNLSLELKQFSQKPISGPTFQACVEQIVPAFGFTKPLLYRNLIYHGKIFSLSDYALPCGIQALQSIKVCLGWDTETDLDASVTAFDENYNNLGTSDFQDKDLFDGKIKHGGDNLTGQGEGDDETILINLSALPENVKIISIQITSYKGLEFTSVYGGFLRIVDTITNLEIVFLRMDEFLPHTGFLFAFLYKNNAGLWDIIPVYNYADAKTGREFAPIVERFLKTSGFLEGMLSPT